MSELAIIVISDLSTLVFSVGLTMIGFAVRWGEVKTDLKYMKTAIAEMRGTFVLRPLTHGEMPSPYQQYRGDPGDDTSR